MPQPSTGPSTVRICLVAVSGPGAPSPRAGCLDRYDNRLAARCLESPSTVGRSGYPNSQGVRARRETPEVVTTCIRPTPLDVLLPRPRRYRGSVLDRRRSAVSDVRG